MSRENCTFLPLDLAEGSGSRTPQLAVGSPIRYGSGFAPHQPRDLGQAPDVSEPEFSYRGKVTANDVVNSGVVLGEE